MSVVLPALFPLLSLTICVRHLPGGLCGVADVAAMADGPAVVATQADADTQAGVDAADFLPAFSLPMEVDFSSASALSMWSRPSLCGGLRPSALVEAFSILCFVG